MSIGDYIGQTLLAHGAFSCRLLTCRGPIPKRKEALGEVGLLEKGCIASYKGKIVFIGDEREFRQAATA
jgi:hypothetical protein